MHPGKIGDGGGIAGVTDRRVHAAYSKGIRWGKGWVRNGVQVGATSRQLEALRIKLTGDMAKKYDVYYRTYVSRYKWLGWAKNGESAGTAGYGYRLEGLQIVLVEKRQDIYQLNPGRPKTAAFKSKDIDDLSLKTQ
jgi:uncharacterized protein YjdB